MRLNYDGLFQRKAITKKPIVIFVKRVKGKKKQI